ncbi:MAG: MarR family transcriptional regulator [Deltaproteobacteria bacterium]|nr:MarR family transcriptional regulator [Deltaproteobacteria bacterium]
MDEAELLRFRRQHLGRLLAEVQRDFSIRVKAKLAQRRHPGIKPAHTQVFASLPLAGARLTQIAQRAGITKQSMGALVSELEDLGYLTRAPDPEDGRATQVRFTRKGRRMLHDAVAATAEAEAEYASRIGARRVDELRRSLAEIVDALHIDIPA